MKFLATFVSCALVLLSQQALAGVVEKPIYTKFKDTPIKENIVLSYVQFGTLPNGANAVQATSRTRVRYYSRPALMNPGIEYYTVDELDCRSGIVQSIGAGNLEKSIAWDSPPAAVNVRQMNPRNLPVFRDICTAVDIEPSW